MEQVKIIKVKGHNIWKTDDGMYEINGELFEGWFIVLKLNPFNENENKYEQRAKFDTYEKAEELVFYLSNGGVTLF